MTGRAVKEWVGKTPDTRVPDRVRLRVLEAYGWRCHFSGREIRPGDEWDLDHIIALAIGGENRETNLAPILRSVHPNKTRQDAKLKSKGARLRKKRMGLCKPRRPMQGSRDDKWRKPLHGPAVLRNPKRED